MSQHESSPEALSAARALSIEESREGLKSYLVDLSADAQEKILKFYELILIENQTQNLTRLTSPSDFYFGHVIDVLELLGKGWVQFPALDLGSGGGVPGLLAALLGGGNWFLCDSEKAKARFLESSIQSLGLGEEVKAIDVRAEDFLRKNSVNTITVRAVGKIEKIYGWIRKCSTWNTIILFKGPGWDEEWAEFQKSKFKNELRIENEYSYDVCASGAEKKHRKLIALSRVPRGTFEARSK